MSDSSGGATNIWVAFEPPVTKIAHVAARYGLVVVIAWIGLLKFTSYEAHGIEPLVAHSPFMSWLYDVFSVTTFSDLLGVFEVVTALLIALKPWVPKLSAVGSIVAVFFFLTTLSFMFTTPGIGEATAGGFPVLSSTGQFLIKDAALLGLSLWTLSDALRAAHATTSTAVS
jgi:reactive chlorine resistance protein C